MTKRELHEVDNRVVALEVQYTHLMHETEEIREDLAKLEETQDVILGHIQKLKETLHQKSAQKRNIYKALLFLSGIAGVVIEKLVGFFLGGEQ